MLNTATFLDANSCRLDKNILYCPKTDEKYNSLSILKVISGIGQKLLDKGIEKEIEIYLSSDTDLYMYIDYEL